METKYVMKSKPLLKDETKALLELIETSKIITSKATNATSNKLKDEEWRHVADKFNATTSNTCRRTPRQLRLKCENLKKNARKRCTKIRLNNLQTGSGVGEYIPPNEILERVTSLLGSTASGLIVSYGGDKESEEFVLLGDGGGSLEENGDGVEELGGKARVNLEILDLQDAPMVDPHIEMVVVPTPPHSTTAPAKPCAVAEHVRTQTTPRRATFSRSGKRKLQVDGSKSARDLAIAEYYRYKKQCLELKLENIMLENKKLKLEIEHFKK